jgi:hypothetical protein
MKFSEFARKLVFLNFRIMNDKNRQDLQVFLTTRVCELYTIHLNCKLERSNTC